MPLTPTRANLITGPGLVTRGTLVTHCKDAIKLKFNQRYADVRPMSHGLIDKRLLGQDVEMSFTPAGYVNTTMIAALWGYFANLNAGASLLTTSDVPTTIKSADGTGTIIASAITKLPDIILGPDQSFLGPMTIRGVVGTGMALSTPSSLFTYLSDAPSTVDTAMTAASFKQQAYTTGTFAPATGQAQSSFEAQDRWTISFSVQTEDIYVQGNLRDIRYTGIEVMARCRPVRPTTTEYLAGAGLSAAATIPGRAQAVVAGSLAITGTDGTTVVTLPLASMVDGGFAWSTGELLQDEIGFFVSRGFSSGAQSALYTVTSS